MKTLISLMLVLFSTQTLADYTFISAPRGAADLEKAMYDPLAEHLSKVTGETVSYKPPRIKANKDIGAAWNDYRVAVRDNSAHFYFDGPHFGNYRHTFKNGQFIVRLIEPLKFVVVTRSELTVDMSRLDGRSACLHPEPNLATLTFLSMFALGKHPYHVTIDGFDKAYEGLVKGKCVVTVMPVGVFNKLNKDSRAKIIHAFKPLPNQVLMASQDVPREMVIKIRNSLMNGDCTGCEKILTTYSSKGFTTVNEEDYAGISNVLLYDFFLGKDIKIAMGNK